MVDGVSGRKQHFIEKEGSGMSMNIAIDGPAGAGKSTIAIICRSHGRRGIWQEAAFYRERGKWDEYEYSD